MIQFYWNQISPNASYLQCAVPDPTRRLRAALPSAAELPGNGNRVAAAWGRWNQGEVGERWRKATHQRDAALRARVRARVAVAANRVAVGALVDRRADVEADRARDLGAPVGLGHDVVGRGRISLVRIFGRLSCTDSSLESSPISPTVRHVVVSRRTAIASH